MSQFQASNQAIEKGGIEAVVYREFNQDWLGCSTVKAAKFNAIWYKEFGFWKIKEPNKNN